MEASEEKIIRRLNAQMVYTKLTEADNEKYINEKVLELDKEEVFEQHWQLYLWWGS